jgi:hypothetical protein
MSLDLKPASWGSVSEHSLAQGTILSSAEDQEHQCPKGSRNKEEIKRHLALIKGRGRYEGAAAKVR